MRKILLASLFLTACLSVDTPQVVVTPESGVDAALRATVALVENGAAYCGGVFVDRWVLTAEHCIRGREGVEVVLYGDFDDSFHAVVSYPFAVAAVDETQDLATLTALATLPKIVAVAPLAAVPPVIGATVVTVGHPLGVPFTITTGIVSTTKRRGIAGRAGAVWTQVSIDITYGNSGGPLFNRYGEVVGIASFMLTRSGEHHLAGFVHLDSIRKVVAQ